MDTRFSTVDEWCAYFNHCAQKHGAAYASNHIDGFYQTYGTTSEFLHGMKVAFSSASSSELRRSLHTIQALGDAGINIPMEALFQMGLPQKDFILKCNFTHGRLGDCMAQMAYLIHAMRELNLVLAVKPPGGTSKTVLLSCSEEFSSELFMLDMTTSASDYLNKVASSIPFDRSLLSNYSSKLLCNLKQVEVLCTLRKKLEDTIVLHVRSGDGLFHGGNMFLPPIRYYLDSIQKSGLRKVLVVAEPFYKGKDPFPSPVPGLITSFCVKHGIECEVQSNDLLDYDVAALFYATQVVASNSSLSKIIPLYGDSCKSLISPYPLDGGKTWFKDASITHVDCWERFDREKWRVSLDYRLAWVSGQA